MPEPLIVLDDVTVVYRQLVERITSFKEYALRWLGGRPAHRDLRALDGVSLTVRPGELLAVLGRNGAGKSTLLKVMARILVASEGRVVIRGRVAPLIELGAAFHTDLSAEENVRLNGSLLGHADDEVRARYDAVVAFAELGGMMHQPLRELSSGMIARLGFAVATMRRPDVLLVDEALAVGDAAFQAKCLDRIAAFRAAGTAVVLVSHQLDMLGRCDRAVLLDRGRVVTEGDPVAVGARFERLMGLDPDADRSAEAAVDDETAADRDVVATVRRRCESLDSVFCAVRLHAELGAVASRHGFEMRRVVQLGPGCLPATLACFLAAGAERAVALGRQAQQPFDRATLRLLADYLAPTSGIGWWRFEAERYRGDALASPMLFEPAQAVTRMAAVEVGVDADDDHGFTLAFAFGSLEHTPDPGAVLDDLATRLAPGAGVVLNIDLADLTASDPLADLESDEATYRAACQARPEGYRLPTMPPGLPPAHAFANRWRTSDHRAALEERGFAVMAVEPIVTLRPERIRPERLAAPFRDKTIDDLAIVAVRIVARRR